MGVGIVGAHIVLLHVGVFAVGAGFAEQFMNGDIVGQGLLANVHQVVEIGNTLP